MSVENILFERKKGQHGDLGIIILNRPEVLNAMTTEMCHQTYDQLNQWAEDETIKAVVIRGNGERAFCAGGDIRHFYQVGLIGYAESTQFFWHEYRLNQRIFNFPKPYIALMHGITMGGGAGVSINGSHRVAAENLIFAMPETGIGFHPDIGGGYFLARCIDRVGFYLGLTGEKIPAVDALYAGLVDAIIPYQQFDNFISQLADKQLGKDANAAVSELLHSFAVGADNPALKNHRVIIDRCFSLKTMPEILSALENENVAWARHTAKILEKRAPLSLLITLRKLQESSILDFDHCIKMDYRLTLRFLMNHDFYEGIRAAIIDKDKNPKWEPALLKDVDPQQVDEYFAPLKEEELHFNVR